MKNFCRYTKDGYEVKVRNYKYKSKPPCTAFISGTVLGEEINHFGEPCYFYTSVDAYSMKEAIIKANAVITAKHEVTEIK